MIKDKESRPEVSEVIPHKKEIAVPEEVSEDRKTGGQSGRHPSEGWENHEGFREK